LHILNSLFLIRLVDNQVLHCATLVKHILNVLWHFFRLGQTVFRIYIVKTK
jgi:hypothetical protein